LSRQAFLVKREKYEKIHFFYKNVNKNPIQSRLIPLDGSLSIPDNINVSEVKNEKIFGSAP
jgi:hypothetical protein